MTAAALPEGAEELLRKLEEPSDGYLSWPLPHERDEDCVRLIDSFLDSGTSERRAMVEALSLDQAQTLGVFAERMASHAVHSDSTEPLVRGLVAVGMAAAEDYSKELIPLLALFWRSAEHLTIDPDALFATVSELLGDEAPGWLLSFPEREPANRTPEVMMYEETLDSSELLYRRAW